MANKATAKASKTAATAVGADAMKIYKEQFLKSARYAHRRDLINALLEDGKAYTAQEVSDLVDAYLKTTLN